MKDQRSVDQVLNDWRENPGPTNPKAPSHLRKGVDEAASPSKEALDLQTKLGPIFSKHGFKRFGDEYIKKEKLATTRIRLYFKVDGNDEDQIIGDMLLETKAWPLEEPLTGSKIPVAKLDQVLQNCDYFYQEVVSLDKILRRALKYHGKIEDIVD